jgi:ABC-type branched-subunit amino acid transport system substrate-binding protein
MLLLAIIDAFNESPAGALTSGAHPDPAGNVPVGAEYPLQPWRAACPAHRKLKQQEGRHELFRQSLVVVGPYHRGCRPARAAEPIYLGLVDEVTGPQAEAGVLTMNGVKLAVDDVNAAGGIMGRPVELRVEDNGSTNPGTVLAYSKLVDQGGVVAVIGPLRSTQVQAASPTSQGPRLHRRQHELAGEQP